MTAFRDLTGQRFGRLVALSFERDEKGRIRWVLLCDCGSIHKATLANLAKPHGATRSCGCLLRENSKKIGQGNTRHGDTAGYHTTGQNSREYEAWHAIKERCLNPRCRSYRRYGGRGITICDEWANDYEAFLRHVGRRPSPRHSIDRIDNNRGYEPGNLRWATKAEQGQNTSATKLTPDLVRLIRQRASLGELHASIAEDYGTSKSTISLVVTRKRWTNV